MLVSGAMPAQEGTPTPSPEPPAMPAPDATPEGPEVPAPTPDNEAPPEPGLEMAPQAPVGSAEISPQPEMQAPQTARLWRLLGGGEVVGTAVKRTPDAVYIDIGPKIIELSRESIIEDLSLQEAAASSDSNVGLGESVFDPRTGTVTFRNRADGGQILSQQGILERVRQGVVLISNPAGLGTGWMLDDSGRIVTNHHVVGQEKFQTVTLSVKRNGRWESVRIQNNEVVAFSDLYDIAIVQLDMEAARERNVSLFPLTIAPPASLEAGDVVYAIGNPGMGSFVLEQTISEGIVSSLTRNFGDVLYLQTTASVNPGNSGGPLVNRRGEVVGLITLKAAFQEGVAFALPNSSIRHFLENVSAYAVTDANRNTGFRYHRPQ